MDTNQIREILFHSLQDFGIQIISHEQKMVYLEKDYTIEIEATNLFKLLHNNQVIAPFNDIEELCNFIKMDMLLNEEN